MNENCIFCDIAQGKSPAEIEYEDPEVIGFWDIHPKTPIHILVIPKKHLASIEAITDADIRTIGMMFQAAKKIANKKNLTENGYRLTINYGRHSGMEIEHLHLHLLGGKSLGPMA